jgi:NAD(P)-dependent dehydrogenase (short-subunit alcohol dehydrogenase family)
VHRREFERILAINLKSVFYGCQAAIRHMIRRARARS